MNDTKRAVLTCAKMHLQAGMFLAFLYVVYKAEAGVY